MKIAYLILAHENPRLLSRTIAALSNSESRFFVHIDRKSDLADFIAVGADNVSFSANRIPVYWAEYSMVEAILLLMQQSIGDPMHFDYFVLLSGSDYPITRSGYIHRYIDERRGAQFISMAKIPNAAAGLPLSKITTLTVSSTKPLLYPALKAMTKLGVRRRHYRSMLGGLQPFGGSTWWALSRDAAEYVVAYSRDNPTVCRFFRHSPTPDETFFHTILGNSRFGEKLHRSLTYDDWSAGGVHPLSITDEHIALFRSTDRVTLDDAFGPGEMLFARKFSDTRLDLINRVDDMINRKSASYA